MSNVVLPRKRTNASGDEPVSESVSEPGDDHADDQGDTQGHAPANECSSNDGGASDHASSSNDEPPDRRDPPCRAAARYLVRCPECRVSMQIRHLQYKHVCKRSADPRARAAQMQEQARARFRTRAAP